MSEADLQTLESGPGGPGRARVGHGPLSNAKSLPGKGGEKWTAFQPETYPQEDTSLVGQCLTEARAAGHREQGLRGLRNRIPKLLAFLNERALALQELGVEEALEYQSWMIQGGRRDGRPYCNSTVVSYLKAAAHFYGFLERRGVVLSNPFAEIRRVRAEKRLPRNLPKEPQMEALLSALSRFDLPADLGDRITRYRVHLIAELMYATGIRASEAAFLRPTDVDFKRGLLFIREGKGGASRVAYLNQYCLQILKLYIERLRPLIHARRWARRGELLFGCDWTSFGKLVNRTLRPIATQVSLRRFTSHDFRHCLGYHLLRSGCNIRHIQQILGHRRLRNTEVYTKVDREQLREVLDAFHPRKWKV